jgi:uncharacterized protein YjgD (DUF1641 family)
MTDTTSPPALPNEPQPSEIERLTLAMREALTDSMVERLSVTSANALEVVDRLNDDETRAAVHSVIDQISELHRIGALQTLFDFVALFHAARSAATDNIVERLFAFLEHILNTVGSEEMASLADNMRLSMDEAAAETAATPASGGLFSALKLLSKPESQQSLQFLLTFGEKLRAAQSGTNGQG